MQRDAAVLREDFRKSGSLPAIRLLDEETLEYLRAVPINDEKYRGANDRKSLWLIDDTTFSVASSKAITGTLDTLFEEAGYYLWGAQLVDRAPGHAHPWHSDIETSREGFVSLWIGIAGAGERSSLSVIEGSHLFPNPVQAFWPSGHAARLDPAATSFLAHPDIPDGAKPMVATCGDGDGVFFDGRLWHGSFNSSGMPRRALLLQYGRRDAPVRWPKSLSAYPFEFDHFDSPLTTPLRGAPNPVVNKSIERGPEGSFTLPTAKVCARPQLTETPGRSWTMHPYFQVETPLLAALSCHASVLSPGYMPHLPHQHDEEEVLVVLSGKGAIFALSDRSGALRAEPAGPGDIFYYPRGMQHTISNLSGPGEPLRYVMFKWAARSGENKDAQGFKIPAAKYEGEERLWIDWPSSGLEKIHIHSTTLAAGRQAFGRHIDRYDGALLVLSGDLTVLDQTLGPGGVFLTRAGEVHDTRNTSNAPCRYLAFEFIAMAD